MPDGQLEEGSLLNERYRILGVIGQGGMGTVYQAEHERLNAIVAVKEIRGTPVTGTAQQATMEQYEQEARFLVRLNHPNLPKVTDAFVDGDRFYLVMDFVEGVTLDNRLRTHNGGTMDAETVVDWAIEIADVLGYLHTQDPPIIFRDLKPSNVMVQPDGHIKLIDFGIARRFQPGASHDTALLGSVGYSPPEQFGRHQTDTRSDIYALGATMHHLLTGLDPSGKPFKFAPVDQINFGVPIALSRLIAQCVSIESELRPPDIGHVSAELRAIRDDMHHVGAPIHGTTGVTDARSATAKARDSERISSKLPGSGPTGVPDNLSATGTDSPDRGLRMAVALLGIVLICGVIFAVHSATSHTNTPRHPGVSVRSSGPVTGTVPDTGPANGNAVIPPASGADNPLVPGSAVVPPPSSGSNITNPAPDPKAAALSVEVLGASPDGKSVRLHVVGEINGKKDMAGMVAAYFYLPDKTPLPARDPKGAYATPTGQLFAEFTFQIDADSKPIDGLIDVPVDQFTSTNNLLFRCIAYADNQSAGQTDLLPLSSDSKD